MNADTVTHCATQMALSVSNRSQHLKLMALVSAITGGYEVIRLDRVGGPTVAKFVGMEELTLSHGDNSCFIKIGPTPVLGIFLTDATDTDTLAFEVKGDQDNTSLSCSLHDKAAVKEVVLQIYKRLDNLFVTKAEVVEPPLIFYPQGAKVHLDEGDIYWAELRNKECIGFVLGKRATQTIPTGREDNCFIVLSEEFGLVRPAGMEVLHTGDRKAPDEPGWMVVKWSKDNWLDNFMHEREMIEIETAGKKHRLPVWHTYYIRVAKETDTIK